MLVRRIIVIVVSLLVGVVVTVGLVTYVLETTVAEYGTFYFSMTAFFLACAVAIWLDKFLDTGFLPE